MSSTADNISINDNTTAPSPKKMDATVVSRTDWYGTSTSVRREIVVSGDWYDGTDDGLARVIGGRLQVGDTKVLDAIGELTAIMKELLVEVKALREIQGIGR